MAQYNDVVFSAGGENYTFRWGTNATVVLEKKTGAPATKFFQRISKDPSIGDLVLVMQAGLARHHKLTEEQVGDIIDEIGGPEKIIEIFEKANPQKGDAKRPVDPPRQRASGTGKRR